jgi:hypothetical protein
MREVLAQRAGIRARYTARFERFGQKTAFRGPPKTTILVKDVKDAQGELVTDHLWLNLTNDFAKLGLRAGDRIAFDARSVEYEKGRKGPLAEAPTETDYKLSHPSNIELLERAAGTKPTGGHHCHADGCTVPVKPELLMCSTHWRMVPGELQKLVWSNYREGQCDDQSPSKAWCVAADRAVAVVALAEGKRPRHGFVHAFYPADVVPKPETQPVESQPAAPVRAPEQLGLFGASR